MKYLTYLFLLGLVISSSACEKDESNAPLNTEAATITLKVDYVFGSQALPWELDKMMLHPKTGDSLNFQSLKFYLSNFSLERADGSFWKEDNSYHLIDAATSSAGAFSLEVPAGSYTHLHFKTGIDSARIVDGPYDGDLDINHGMMFSNGHGYAMLKAEGLSPQGDQGSFSFALGDYSQAYSMVQDRSMSFFGEEWNLNGGSNHEIILQVNPAKLWHYAPGLDSVSHYSGGGNWAEMMGREFFGAVSLKDRS